jgi:sulfonate transport system ATP-binding protein
MRNEEDAMTAPQPEGIDILHVSKRYGTGDDALVVLDDVTLRVRPGEFVSVLGASGCGKSTLLRLIAGLDAGYSGAIMAGGERVRDTSLDRGIVFQDHRLFPWLTAAQNIFAALRNAPLSQRQKQEAVAEHIALVGLEGFENAYPHQLSGGMAQRVAIARGLVNRPRVLLLDEPFGALDALTRGRLQNELQRIWERERITMILVTHDVDEAVYLGERVVTMAPRPGRIRRIVEVALPRPRERSDPRFVALRDAILADFTGETAGSDGAPPAPPRESDEVRSGQPFTAWRLAW